MTSQPTTLHPIDCHVLWLPGQRDDWWQECRQSLLGEPINVHRVEGIPGDYVTARCRAFAVGSAPFVSYVDPDDLVTRGAFAHCLWKLAAPDVVMVWTDSVRLFESGERKLVNARRPHQLIVARRWAVEQALEDGDAGDAELWRRVAQLGVVEHLGIVGYAWRQHPLSPAGRLARSLASC